MLIHLLVIVTTFGTKSRSSQTGFEEDFWDEATNYLGERLVDRPSMLLIDSGMASHDCKDPRSFQIEDNSIFQMSEEGTLIVGVPAEEEYVDAKHNVFETSNVRYQASTKRAYGYAKKRLKDRLGCFEDWVKLLSIHDPQAILVRDQFVREGRKRALKSLYLRRLKKWSSDQKALLGMKELGYSSEEIDRMQKVPIVRSLTSHTRQSAIASLLYQLRKDIKRYERTDQKQLSKFDAHMTPKETHLVDDTDQDPAFAEGNTEADIQIKALKEMRAIIRVNALDKRLLALKDQVDSYMQYRRQRYEPIVLPSSTSASTDKEVVEFDE